MVWTVFLFILSISSVAAVELDSLNRDPEYVASIKMRSEKIVDGLNLSDRNVRSEVTRIIANRYFELNDIYTARDTAIDAAKRKLPYRLPVTKRMQHFIVLILLFRLPCHCF